MHGLARERLIFTCSLLCNSITGLILGLHQTNERRRYKVTPAVKLQNLVWHKTGFAAPFEAARLDLSQNVSMQNLHSIKY